jgi:inhibitor of cysteine peptidase
MNTPRWLMAIGLSGLMAACAATPTPSSSTSTPPEPAVTTSASASPPEQRQLSVGEALDLELPGNPSPGYVWEVLADGAPVLRQDSPPARAASGATEPPMVGAPSPSQFRFVGAQPGRTQLHLVYRRPWQRDVEPAEEIRLNVEVR